MGNRRPGCYVCERYAEGEYLWKGYYWCSQCLGDELIMAAEERGEVVHVDDEEAMADGGASQD